MKKLLSLFLAFVMALGILPAGAFAAGTAANDPPAGSFELDAAGTTAWNGGDDPCGEPWGEHRDCLCQQRDLWYDGWPDGSDNVGGYENGDLPVWAQCRLEWLSFENRRFAR